MNAHPLSAISPNVIGYMRQSYLITNSFRSEVRSGLMRARLIRAVLINPHLRGGARFDFEFILWKVYTYFSTTEEYPYSRSIKVSHFYEYMQ